MYSMPEGQIIGYRRVSSVSQSLDRQELPDVKGRIFEEKLTGANRDRPALQEMIAYVRDGDEVHVHSIDRLARSLRDLEDIVAEVVNKGASIRFLKEGLHFSKDKEADPFQTLMFQMLGAFSEFERTLIKTRQAEGIKKKKEQDPDAYQGRKPSINYDLIWELSGMKMSPDLIAQAVGIGRNSVFRIKRAMKSANFVPVSKRINNLEGQIKQCDDTDKAQEMVRQLNEYKRLHNQVWSIVYEYTNTKQPEAFVFLKSKGWSAKQIAENKEVDEGYVEYILDNTKRDGLFAL
jgi:DNA invertase Pin-like site-specific DNA recombinase